jgi:dihydrodipicolinate synthase/N-acetylneuraminate lyase
MEYFLGKALTEIPTLVGMKFSSRDLVDMIGCVNLDGGRLNIFFGTDEVRSWLLALNVVFTH